MWLQLAFFLAVGSFEKIDRSEREAVLERAKQSARWGAPYDYELPDRPYSDPEKAARKILESAKSVEPVQDGRIYIELINGPFLFKERGTRPKTGPV